MNFCQDGDNWSGWRLPESEVEFEPSNPAALAGVENHLYIFAPRFIRNIGETTRVWAY